MNDQPDSQNAGGSQGGSPVRPPAKRSFARRYAFPLVLFGLCVILGAYLLWNSLSGGGSKLTDQGPAADFTYTDIDGKPVTMSEENGKVRLVYFFYSNCPDVCPPTTFMMSQVQNQLKDEGKFGSQVEFLSITIDPTRDTPEALKTFGDKFNADYTGWKFLRGDEAETADLAKKYNLLVQKDNEGNFGHSNLIVLVDKKGHIRDYISPQSNGDPTDVSADELTTEIKPLL